MPACDHEVLRPRGHPRHPTFASSDWGARACAIVRSCPPFPRVFYALPPFCATTGVLLRIRPGMTAIKKSMFGRLSLLYIGVIIIIIINPLNSLARAFKSQRGLKDSDDGGGGRMVSKWLYHPYDMQPSKFVTGSMGTQQWPLEFRSPAPVPRLLQAPRGGDALPFEGNPGEW